MTPPRLPPLRRATQLAADAIKACEEEGVPAAMILGGFTIALQRLTLQAATARNPAGAARLAQAFQGITDLVKAARGR